MLSELWSSLTRSTWPFKQHREVDDAFDRAAARLEASHAGYLVHFLAWLAGRYAHWTDDLPASERYHHVRPFGLLIHSAETVERAFAIRRDLMEFFPPVWHQVLVALALLHDCGRLFDVAVSDADRGESWDPLQISLREFRRTRYARPMIWRAGRGIHTHEWRSLDLLPILLGEDDGDEYRWRLNDAWCKYLGRHWRKDDIPAFQAFAIAQLVASADQLSVQQDRRTTASRPPPEGGANAPVRCYSTPLPSRSVFSFPFRGGPKR